LLERLERLHLDGGTAGDEVGCASALALCDRADLVAFSRQDLRNSQLFVAGPPLRLVKAASGPMVAAGRPLLRLSHHRASTGVVSGRSRSITNREANAPLWRRPALTRRRNDSSRLSSMDMPGGTDADKT